MVTGSIAHSREWLRPLQAAASLSIDLVFGNPHPEYEGERLFSLLVPGIRSTASGVSGSNRPPAKRNTAPQRMMRPACPMRLFPDGHVSPPRILRGAGSTAPRPRGAFHLRQSFGSLSIPPPSIASIANSIASMAVRQIAVAW